MDATTTTLEQVIYRLVEGSTEEAFLATNQATQAWLEAQPGFLGRELAVDPDGTWVDHVWWADLHSAETAAAAYMATDACHQLSAFLAQESVSFRHARIVRSTGAARTRVAA
jgi:antibiotic biosynthesis monooxygenase (ABM) superfamily enzyme